MRWALMLAAAALLVPFAAGHETDLEAIMPAGSYLNHLELWEPDLAAGEQRMPLAFSGSALQEDWLLVVHGVVANGSVQVGVWDEGGPTWTWTAGNHTQTIRVAHSGFPEIWARQAEGNASLRLYYDQTCDCIGKGAPLSAGPLWFNTDADQGDQVAFMFKMQPGPLGFGRPDGYDGALQVTMRLVEADRTGRQLVTLEEQRLQVNASTDSCFQDGTWGVCHWFNFTARHDGRQAVLLEFAHDRPDWGFMVRPTLQVHAATDAQVPGVGLVGAVAVLAAVALRRR